MEDLFVPENIDLENDPVVSEMPIYLNTEKQPVVLQYPTRKLTDRARNQDAAALRLKPQTSMIEVDIASDMPQGLTDSDRKARWNEINCQTFGGMMRPSGDRYAIGKVDGEALYLTRVSQTAQLRPQFDHFNQQTKDEKERLQPKDEKPAVIRSVQVSAKSASETVSRYSEVIEFYKNVSLESHENYEIEEAGEEQHKVLRK